MKITMLVVSAALALPSLASADDPKASPDTTIKDKDKSAAKLSDAEVGLLAHLHHVNMTEIDAGKLVQQKGSAKAVKDYAKTMVMDHQQADKKITAFAKERGVAKLPMDKPMTDEEKTAHKDLTDSLSKLKTLKGPELDRAYLSTIITGHERVIAKLEGASSKITDTAMADMIRDLKPVLQSHADRARELQANMEQTSRVDQPTPPPPAP